LYVAFIVVLSCDISIFISSTYMCLSDGSHCGNNSQFVLMLNVQLLTGCLEERYERKMFLCISLFQKKSMNLLTLLIAGWKLTFWITRCYICVS